MRKSALVLLMVSGCASAELDDKGTGDETLLPGGAADSFTSPTEHGALSFSAPQEASLSAREGFHAWDFSLDGDASVVLRTGVAAGNGGKVDTVMYLYKRGARGWGSYLDRNDDIDGTRFSRIARTLDAGEYRVLVKGYNARAMGPFALSAECAGDGCPSAPAPGEPSEPSGACSFGATYRELLSNAAFEGVSFSRVTPGLAIEPARAAQIIRAVQVSRADVSSLDEALASVDGDEVNVTEVVHRGTRDRFVAIEFGAGDNSYGAVFYAASTSVAAEIRDGDLYACTFVAPLDGTGPGGDCHTGECATGLQCVGMNPTTGIGRCASTSPITGEGDLCSASQSCGTDRLTCVGLSRDAAEGFCVPFWMQRTFAEPGPWVVPDADARGLSREIQAYGLATVDVDVWVSGLLNHPFPADLLVTLTNPAGTTATIFDGENEDASEGYLELDNVVARFSGDESVNGAWTLRVVDRFARDIGTLERWSLTISSRWD